MRLPQLSLPWAILASVVVTVLGILVFFGKVQPAAIGTFVAGVLLPLWKQSQSDSAPSTKPSGVPPLPLLFLGTLAALSLACAKGSVPKAEYGAQVDACVKVSHTRDEFEACFHGVQIKWNEAGAPPALVFPKDGGDQ